MTEGCIHCSEDERRHSEHNKEAQVLIKIQEISVSKNSDEKVCLQSEKREECKREVRGYHTKHINSTSGEGEAM